MTKPRFLAAVTAAALLAGGPVRRSPRRPVT